MQVPERFPWRHTVEATDGLGSANVERLPCPLPCATKCATVQHRDLGRGRGDEVMTELFMAIFDGRRSLPWENTHRRAGLDFVRKDHAVQLRETCRPRRSCQS